MTLRASTGLRNAMLATGSLKSVLALGSIKIYAGAVPADADAAIGSATLLTTITVNSGATGLSLAASASLGAISKANEVWSGINATGGTASFWRFIAAAGDDGTASTTQPRLQGLAASSGSELVMTSTTVSGGATQNIDYFSVALPA